MFNVSKEKKINTREGGCDSQTFVFKRKALQNCVWSVGSVVKSKPEVAVYYLAVLFLLTQSNHNSLPRLENGFLNPTLQESKAAGEGHIEILTETA